MFVVLQGTVTISQRDGLGHVAPIRTQSRGQFLASDLQPRLNSPATEAPYVGVFTGELVDGKPLYRFPSIEVIGSRHSVSRELSEPNGS